MLYEQLLVASGSGRSTRYVYIDIDIYEIMSERSASVACSWVLTREAC